MAKNINKVLKKLKVKQKANILIFQAFRIFPMKKKLTLKNVRICPSYRVMNGIEL